MAGSDNGAESSTGVGRRILLAIVAAAAIAIVLGVVGFQQHFATQGKVVPFADLLYLSLQLFGLESGLVEGDTPGFLQVARFLAPGLTIVTVVVALVGIFRAEFHAFRVATVRNHVVVCGVGRKAIGLIQDFRRDQIPVIAIEHELQNRLLRDCEDAGAYVIRDDASRPGCLEAAQVHRATTVFVTTGDDSTNVEIASRVVNLIRGSGVTRARHPLACYVHLVDHQTHQLFRQHRVFQQSVPAVRIHVFNVFDNAARILWRRHLMALGPLGPTDTRRLHVVIGGLGRMGEAVLLRLARSAHYANRRPTAVTIADRAAGQAQARLAERYPMLANTCALSFVTGDLMLPGVRREIAERLKNSGDIGAVVLCQDNDYDNLSIALHLVPHLPTAAIPVLIRLALANGLADLLRSENSGSALAKQITAFGLVDECSTRETVVADALYRRARLIHERYVNDNATKIGNRPDDPSLLAWDRLPEALKESNIEQAEHLELKLRTFGFSSDDSAGPSPPMFQPDQIETLARMEHTRWCAERWLAGWRFTPGPKDVARRTSPFLCPWEDLDETTKEWNRQAVRAIPGLISASRST